MPMSTKELPSFLGLASYYCCFISKFPAIAKWVCDLVGPTDVKRKTKKEPEAVSNSDKKFKWTGEHCRAFDLLHTHLMSAPVLGYLDFSRSFNLQLMHHFKDWVLFLFQRDENGKSRVIA